MVTIWPAYEGSVRTSWYPVMLVLNTTSPCASPDAPAATPRYQVPSSRASVAFIRIRGVWIYDDSLFERCCDASASILGDRHLRHPLVIPGHFQPDCVSARSDPTEQQWCATNQLIVHVHA